MNSDELFVRLERYGADVAGAKARFVGDVELYGECLRSLLSDDGFERLGAALRDNDRERAFYEAHTLKGTTGNLGLTPLYDAVCAVVEPLRNSKGDCAALEGKYYDALMQFEIVKELMA